MNNALPLAFIMVIAIPFGWFLSEIYSSNKYVRISLGILSILSGVGVAWIFSILNTLNYNARYGGASQRLLNATVEKLEKGDVNRVIIELKKMQDTYKPTYESKANYNVIADETAERIKNGPVE